MKILNNKKFLIFIFLVFLGLFSGAQKVEAATCKWLLPLGNVHCPGPSYKDYAVQDEVACVRQGVAARQEGAECCCSTILPPIATITTTTAEKIITPATKTAAVLNNPFDNLSVDIPGLYESISCKQNSDGSYTCPKVNCESSADGSTSCEVPWIGQYIIAIYNYALIIIGSLAAVTLMAAGVIWLISGSNASRMKTAKEMIIGSVSGLIVMFSSYMIISMVNPDILIFKPLKISYIPEFMPDYSDSTSSSDNPYQEGCNAFRNSGKKDTTKCAELGSKIKINLVNYNNSQVSPVLKSKLEKVFACVKTKNNGTNPFTISGGARTPAKSIELYKRYKSGKGNMAADPCCSNHMSGNAVDIQLTQAYKDSHAQKEMSWKFNNSSGLTECMNKNGLYAKLKPEPWHWSLTGN